MNKRTLVLRYSAFCVMSIAANIATQAIALELYSGVFAIALSMAAGTGTGLTLKYILDKTFIFNHRFDSSLTEAKHFILYTSMGIITTAIFWTTEALFHAAFKSDEMRYVGAILGLIAGYLIKYQLDRKYVFTQHQEDVEEARS